jgi:hypothetical protein
LDSRKEQRDFLREILLECTKLLLPAFSNADINSDAQVSESGMSFNDTAFKNFFSKVFSLLETLRFWI